MSAVHRGALEVLHEGGEARAVVAGRLKHGARGPADLPAVGDWVALGAPGDALVVHAVLPRATSFVRKVVGEETLEQVLVANIDLVFLVAALTEDFNLRRLERYVASTYASGAAPIVVLTKADLCDDVAGRVVATEAAAPGAPVHVTTPTTGEGLSALAEHLTEGITAALLGSSGTGKSTLVNALTGRDLLRTAAVRDDGKGKHTTTHRQMVTVPSGGLVIDTPGMRELGLWDDGEGVRGAFDDVESIARECKFRDCAHTGEPGCAVRAAVARGELDAARVAAYHKLQRELAFLARKQDRRAAAEETRRWKAIHKSLRKEAW